MNDTQDRRSLWLIDRDLDAVAAYLDPWILAADPDHDPTTTAIPLLGTPEWVTADDPTKNAAVALYVLACLAEREPVVIAARLAAEIAAGRTAHLVALRQASHAISAALTTPGTDPARHDRLQQDAKQRDSEQRDGEQRGGEQRDRRNGGREQRRRGVPS
jgi:hypothetical protein